MTRRHPEPADRPDPAAPDNPEWDAETFRRARPARAVLDGAIVDAWERQRHARDRKRDSDGDAGMSGD